MGKNSSSDESEKKQSDGKCAENEPFLFILPDPEIKSLARFLAVERDHVNRQSILAADRQEIVPSGSTLAQSKAHFAQTTSLDKRKISGEKAPRLGCIQTDLHESLIYRPAISPGDEQRHSYRVCKRTKQFRPRRRFEVDIELFRPDWRAKHQEYGENNRRSAADQ